MRAIGVVLVLVAGSPAHAEGPIVVRVGIGVTGQHSTICQGTCDSETRYGPGFQTDIAYRVMDQLAVGVHLGIASNSGTVTESEPPSSIRVNQFRYTALQLGIGAQWSVDPFWLAPWVGIDEGGDLVGDSPRRLAFGFAAGVDLYIGPTGHRVGAYLDVTRSQGYVDAEEADLSDVYVTAGVAYRYW